MSELSGIHETHKLHLRNQGFMVPQKWWANPKGFNFEADTCKAGNCWAKALQTLIILVQSQ